MAKEKLQIVLDVLYKGKGSLKSAERDLTGLDKAAAGAKRNWQSMLPVMTAVGVGLGAVAVAGKAAYASLGRGAELEAAEMKFGNLAESIDSTADAMMGRLKTATQGLMSDANLVASATQIMSLGLQDTEEGVVRLATVSANLGWDMSQVILTMANDSVMRLDALGLSIDAVREKQELLVSAGMDAGKAFDLAVIEAGEEKYELLGDQVNTTAGKMKIFQASVENAQNAFDVELATSFADALGEVGPDAASSVAGIEALTSAVGGLLGTIAGFTLGNLGNQLSANAVTEASVQLGLMSDNYSKQLLQNLKRGTPGSAESLQQYRDILADYYADSNALPIPYTGANANYALPGSPAPFVPHDTSIEGMTSSAKTYAPLYGGPPGSGTRDTIQENKERWKELRREGEAVLKHYEEMGLQTDMLANQTDNATSSMGGYTSSINEAAQALMGMTAASGNLFSRLRGQKEFDLGEEYFDALVGAGYSALEVGQGGVLAGLFDQARADELVNQSFLVQQLQLMAGQRMGVGDIWSNIQGLQGQDGLATEFFAGLDAKEVELGLNTTEWDSTLDNWIVVSEQNKELNLKINLPDMGEVLGEMADGVAP